MVQFSLPVLCAVVVEPTTAVCRGRVVVSVAELDFGFWGHFGCLASPPRDEIALGACVAAAGH